jgi:hypothetical protein
LGGGGSSLHSGIEFGRSTILLFISLGHIKRDSGRERDAEPLYSLTLFGSPGLPALVATSLSLFLFGWFFFGFMVESYGTPVAVSAPF